MNNERRLQSERGFTLVELMIVVAIIAILAGILIPNFVNARAQAQTSACESNIRAIATAEELFYTDNQAYAPAGPADSKTFAGFNGGTPYLNNAPHDPSAVAANINATYQVANANNPDGSPGYQITCPGAHPANTVAKIAQAAGQGNPAAANTHVITYAGGIGFGVDQMPVAQAH